MDVLQSLPAAAGLALMLAGAGRTSLDEQRAALYARGVAQAEELLETCQVRGLHAERDRLCEALIRLDPGHTLARRTLGHRRSGRTWVEGRRRPARNRRGARLDEFVELRTALARRWSAEVRALYRRLDPDGERLEAMLDDVLILAPDDDEARAWRGERRDADGAWVLADTLRARERRVAQEQAARAIREGEPELEALAGERDAPIAWAQALGARHARLYASVPDPHARELLGAAERSGTLFRLAFGEAPSLPPRFAIYLVEGERARRDFLARHPRADERLRAPTRTADGWFDEGSALVFWDGAGPANVRRVVCEGVRCMLRRSFGLRREQAWALEGFGLRLCELAGAAGATERSPSRARGEPGPWEAVRELARTGRLPSLRALLADRDGVLDREQTLLAYALARYLLECHAGDVGRLLDDLGHGGQSLERGLGQVLGLSGERLERRLRRWIDEMN